MNQSKYLVFLKTVELGSITRAAEALGYTQSAVSRVVAELEREWGLELLTRGRTGVEPTSHGEVMLPYMRAVCNAEKELEEQVAELHGLTRGTLRVGTFASVSIHWLPAIMKEFLTLYPGIHFELPPDHPLAGAPFYPMSRLAEDPYIDTPEERDLEIRLIFQEEGIRPNLRYTVNDDFATLAMVEQGLGVSIRPELVLRNTGRRFAAIPLERPRYRDIVLAVRSGRPPYPLTTRVLGCARAWVAKSGR